MSCVTGPSAFVGVTSHHHIRARDGTLLDAYLTVPAGGEGKPHPLVIVLGRDLFNREIPVFKPLTHILATRGIAVLRINHRGVPGYGYPFLRQGRDAREDALHQDIEDTARWALESKAATPGQLAILGEGFGGFSALYALGHSPDLYRFGVVLTAISDWTYRFKQLQNTDERFYFKLYGYDEHAGITEDVLRPKSLRSYADKIKVPVMGAYNNLHVASLQGLELGTALRRAGADPVMHYYNEVPEYGVLGRMAVYKDEVVPATERVVQFVMTQFGLQPERRKR